EALGLQDGELDDDAVRVLGRAAAALRLTVQVEGVEHSEVAIIGDPARERMGCLTHPGRAAPAAAQRLAISLTQVPFARVAVGREELHLDRVNRYGNGQQ